MKAPAYVRVANTAKAEDCPNVVHEFVQVSASQWQVSSRDCHAGEDYRHTTTQMLRPHDVQCVYTYIYMYVQ